MSVAYQTQIAKQATNLSADFIGNGVMLLNTVAFK